MNKKSSSLLAKIIVGKSQPSKGRCSRTSHQNKLLNTNVKTMIELMHVSVFKQGDRFRLLIDSARDQLQTIRETIPNDPVDGSHALLAFDPNFGRRLNSFIPLRVVELPTHEQTWEIFEAMLKGWEEILTLSVTHSLRTWEVSSCSHGTFYCLSGSRLLETSGTGYPKLHNTYP